MKFYTYLHRRSTDGAVFYVGQGSGARARSKCGRSAGWRSVVAEHGYNTEILAEWTSKGDSVEHERVLIACFQAMGAPLVNVHSGGDNGRIGYRHSEAARAGISAAQRGRTGSGYVITKETRARMSASQKARARAAPEIMAKLCADNTGAKRSPETCERIRLGTPAIYANAGGATRGTRAPCLSRFPGAPATRPPHS